MHRTPHQPWDTYDYLLIESDIDYLYSWILASQGGGDGLVQRVACTRPAKTACPRNRLRSSTSRSLRSVRHLLIQLPDRG